LIYKGRQEMAENSSMEEMYAELTRQMQEDYDALTIPITDRACCILEKMLPMSDGVQLKTYIFYGTSIGTLSQAVKEYPVILQRSPYFHAMEAYRIHGENLAKRGFVYVLQFCRGTGGSEGEWIPNINERKDGLDTLKWLEQEKWAGNIGYWGDSYLALTGWCMADALPAKVKGMYLGVYGTDRWTSAYSKRLFRHDVLTSWAMENTGFPVTADYIKSCSFRPQINVDEQMWGQKVPWYRDWITAVNEQDEYWQHGFWKMLRDIPGKIQIPMLITEGWYDHHLGSAIRSYETLNEPCRKMSTLVIGCWNHMSMNCIEWEKAENLQNSEISSMTAWFTTLLMEEHIPKPQVLLYVIGRDEWTELKCWPVPIKEIKKFYFSAASHDQTENGKIAGFLVSEKNQCAGKTEYTYDPDQPVPSLGAESMLRSMDRVGSLYQPDAGYRPDVKTFISEPVTESFVISGKMKVRLWVSTDVEDTAFTAKIMEIKEDGRAVNIRSSVTTIAADRQDEYVPGSLTEVVVEMWDIAWQVHVGSRLRIDISSSDFPQYAVHTNYAGVWSLQDKAKKAHQVIRYDTKHLSCVEIPVMDESFVTRKTEGK